MAEQFVSSMTTARVTNETPAGTLDFSNLVFTLVNVPAAGGIQLFLNGIKMVVTTDYSISGKTITMAEAPHTNDILSCSYYF